MDLNNKVGGIIKDNQLDVVENALREFILHDQEFFELAKKYTFTYREFSSMTDYCELKWNKKRSTWKNKGYYCHDHSEGPPNKKNRFYLDLNVDGYNWGSLFNKMEFEFNEDLEKTMNEDEIEDLIQENYDRYVEFRDEFFKTKKAEIIDKWFKISEESAKDYIERELLRLREAIFEKETIPLK